jgi:hypothetical protein
MPGDVVIIDVAMVRPVPPSSCGATDTSTSADIKADDHRVKLKTIVEGDEDDSNQPRSLPQSRHACKTSSTVELTTAVVVPTDIPPKVYFGS